MSEGMTLHDALTDALANLDTPRRIFCGLTANVDIILHFEGDEFAELQRAYGAAALPPPGNAPPPALAKTPADVLRYAAWFIARGQGGEGDIKGLAPVQPLIDSIPRTRQCRAVGGTGIQAANWLANAGFENTEVYLPQSDPAFDGLIHPGIRCHDNNAGYKELFGKLFGELSGDAAAFSEVHCIVDYAAGTKALTADEETIARASDRVIFSGDKANDKLRISPGFIKAAAEPHPSSSSLLVTGWNGPRTLEDLSLFIDDCVRLMRAYRQGNPTGFIHVEDCYQWHEARARRQAVAERVWPLADSLAMNEVEYGMLTRFFGLAGGKGKSEESIPANLAEIARRHGLRRVCLHTAKKSCAVSAYPRENERRALALATLFSTARAYHGTFVGLEQIADMVERTREVSERATVPASKTIDGRYGYQELPTLYGIAIKSSIGLGDAFCAGQLAYL